MANFESGTNSENSATKAGIYIHIPFCKQACIYCNFHFSTSLKYKKELLNAMLLEIEMQRGYLEGKIISTIYFGGGTPSLLTADEINIIIESIYKNYNVSALEECTLEANPDDLSKEYIKGLNNTPVNRLSIGIQSFKEEGLLYMKRAHTAQQSDYSIKAAQDAGFTNLSIDLIYGIPNLTDKEWQQHIKLVEQMHIPHFSAYALTVEDKTALHLAIQKKKTQPVDPGQAATQFEILMEEAALNGYEHYEISNLSKPGKYAIHNTNYWKGVPYLGIGPSAHSFNGHSRKWNIANNTIYTQSLLTEKKIPHEEEQLTPTQQLNEYIMTSLRTMWGCDITYIQHKWGESYSNDIKSKAIKPIDKELLTNINNQLTLTGSGKLFADRIASELFF